MQPTSFIVLSAYKEKKTNSDINYKLRGSNQPVSFNQSSSFVTEKKNKNILVPRNNQCYFNSKFKSNNSNRKKKKQINQCLNTNWVAIVSFFYFELKLICGWNRFDNDSQVYHQWITIQLRLNMAPQKINWS